MDIGSVVFVLSHDLVRNVVMPGILKETLKLADITGEKLIFRVAMADGSIVDCPSASGRVSSSLVDLQKRLSEGADQAIKKIVEKAEKDVDQLFSPTSEIDGKLREHAISLRKKEQDDAVC